MGKLYDFWIMMTTPGTQLPTSTTVIVLLVIAACAFLLPSFVKWRVYRKQQNDQANAKNVKKTQQPYRQNTKKKRR